MRTLQSLERQATYRNSPASRPQMPGSKCMFVTDGATTAPAGMKYPPAVKRNRRNVENKGRWLGGYGPLSFACTSTYNNQKRTERRVPHGAAGQVGQDRVESQGLLDAGLEVGEPGV